MEHVQTHVQSTVAEHVALFVTVRVRGGFPIQKPQSKWLPIRFLWFFIIIIILRQFRARRPISLISYYYSYANSSLNVTESQKTNLRKTAVPNHTFLFHYIYYCNMNSSYYIFFILFHII